MAESGDVDCMCREVFGIYAEKDAAKPLSPRSKKQGSGSTVRKILKEALGENAATISYCEASILSKYLDKSKKITADDFLGKVLVEVAAKKLCDKNKGKKPDQPAVDAEVETMKKKMGDNLEKLKAGTKTKDAAVVGRLTDTSKYTGSHGQRFDEKGKGKGKGGREEKVDGSGYVQGYGNKDSYGTKK